MVQSKAKTVEEYLKDLPPERREVVAAVRKLVEKHLPKGYVESMAFGMIGWGIPLARYPNTYNGQPLGYVALAAQKNYYSLYLMSVYSDSAEERALRAAFAKAGKKLDMGKCCVRFKKLADLEMEALGRSIAANPPERLIELYEESRRRTARGR
ncbi:MAG TPA: DUF1801 domain-containing protein [Thermoanaerobaculia bacterium]|jgi:hypothetical protein